MREIKFRAWTAAGMKDGSKLDMNHAIDLHNSNNVVVLMQYTGAKDLDGKEIYEGDIYRMEEETDKGDEITYFVCHYIKEWGMFAWLSADEYYDYLAGGVENIDEPMYWTFPIKTEDSKTVKLCGNIYENEYLLSE